MVSTIGVYDTHQKALEAISELKKAGTPESKLSIVGQAELVDDHLHTKSKEGLKAAGLGVGVVLGPLVGVLSGIGLIAIPGLGFLFGMGAVAGAIAGFDIGLIGGGLASVLTMLGIKDEHTEKYGEHLNKGHFLVLAQGSDEEVSKARKVLEAHGTHVDLDMHTDSSKI